MSIKNVSVKFLPKTKFMKFVMLFDMWKILSILIICPPDSGFAQFLDPGPDPGSFPVHNVQFVGYFKN